MSGCGYSMTILKLIPYACYFLIMIFKHYLSIFRGVSVLVTGSVCTTYVLIKNLNAKTAIQTNQLKLGNEVVPAKIQNLIDEVIQDLNFQEKKIKVTPYMSKSIDPETRSSLFKSEILLGIPRYFLYDTDDSEFTAVVDEKEIPKDAPEFQSLKHSMRLSKEAKKYAIAYKMCESQQSDVFPLNILPVAIILHCNFVSFVLDKLSKPSRMSYRLRDQIFAYSFAPLLFVSFYDLFFVYQEFNTNSLLAELGKSYIEGGIEYYEKIIQRNKIYKKLDKKAPYTENGDITTALIRTKHLSLHKRITYLEEYREGKQQSFFHYVS